MIPIELNKLTEADLLRLIDNSIPEGKTLEYKATLPGGADKDRKDFLGDVSAFANTGGGDIIYGITEDPETRIPKELVGLNTQEVDQTCLKLDSMIRDGIDPRLPAVHIRPISLQSGKAAIVIRIGKSWISPHRVIFGGHDKFYSRASNGKYTMDVGELRLAFTLSESIADRIRKFRDERITRLYANETPVPFVEGAKIVLHLLPVAAFDGTHQGIPLSHESHRLRPIWADGYSLRFTLEGLLSYDGGGLEPANAYTHLYRNGILEAVEGSFLDYQPQANTGRHVIESSYENVVRDSLNEYLRQFNTFDIPLPIFVVMTLMGVRDRPLRHQRRGAGTMQNLVVDRDILVLPEVLLETYDVDAAAVMKPIFDAVWNACGYARSWNYDEQGNWRAS